MNIGEMKIGIAEILRKNFVELRKVKFDLGERYISKKKKKNRIGKEKDNGMHDSFKKRLSNIENVNYYVKLSKTFT